jgi:2-polyprenyl-3-methyl-5-hydroxy-6-metoxy-1,4-benzoquinol methylase
MGSEHDRTGYGQFGAGYWEDRYRGGEGAGRHAPSPSLVAETGGLPQGRALDAGCGRGADALWLASRGWSVTAVDISATAVARAREAARRAGPVLEDRIEWVEADLAAWEPAGPSFDLVTSHYVHVPGPAQDMFRRLASWVAPGGTLLVVGHAHADAGGDPDAHPPAAQITAREVTAVLPENTWETVAAEARTHRLQQPGGAGPVTRQDLVVHARRTS